MQLAECTFYEEGRALLFCCLAAVGCTYIFTLTKIMGVWTSGEAAAAASQIMLDEEKMYSLHV